MHVKDGAQVVAIDDAPHRRDDATTGLAFVFCQGDRLEHFFQATIHVDGMDATRTILDALRPRRALFRLVLTHGITVGGLNVIDIEEIHRVLESPVIAVTENEPIPGSLQAAATHVKQAGKRIKVIDEAGPVHAIATRPGETPVYVHLKGIDINAATRFLKVQAVRSRLPECLLLAHKISTGLQGATSRP